MAEEIVVRKNRELALSVNCRNGKNDLGKKKQMLAQDAVASKKRVSSNGASPDYGLLKSTEFLNLIAECHDKFRFSQCVKAMTRGMPFKKKICERARAFFNSVNSDMGIPISGH